jgi:hypothetical protein
LDCLCGRFLEVLVVNIVPFKAMCSHLIIHDALVLVDHQVALHVMLYQYDARDLDQSHVAYIVQDPVACSAIMKRCLNVRGDCRRHQEFEQMIAFAGKFLLPLVNRSTESVSVPYSSSNLEDLINSFAVSGTDIEGETFVR